MIDLKKNGRQLFTSRYIQRLLGCNLSPKIKALLNHQTLFREKTTLEGNCPFNNAWLTDEENLKFILRPKTKYTSGQISFVVS